MTQRKHYQKVIEQKISAQVKHLNENLDDVDAYYTLGEYLVEVDSLEQAESLFLKGLAHFDGDNSATNKLNYGLGNVYYQSQHYQKAQGIFAQIDGSLKPLALLMQAQCFLAQNQVKLALAYAMAASDELSGNDLVAALLVQGQAWLKQGEGLRAKENFTTAAKNAITKAQKSQAHFYLGVSLLALGAPQTEVLAQFNKAKKFDAKFYQTASEKLAAANHLALNAQNQAKKVDK